MSEQALEIVMDPSDAVATALFSESTNVLFGVIQTLAADRGAELPSTRLVAAADVVGAIQSESARIGLAPDPRDGPERVGGVVGGKCLYNAANGQASLIVPVEVAVAADGEQQLLGGELVAHEMVHLLFDVVKDLHVEPSEITWKPWDVAGTITLAAAAEYRVSAMGDLLAQRVLNPTDGNGQEVLVSELTGQSYLDGLPEALDALLPDLADRIWDYRLTGIPNLEDLWREVCTTSHGVIVYLSYTEARRPDGRMAIEVVDHPAVGLLEPVWRPLFSYLRNGELFPEGASWDHDQASLIEIGRDGFTEVWRRLGVEATPQGDDFYLAIGDPDDSYVT